MINLAYIGGVLLKRAAPVLFFLCDEHSSHMRCEALIGIGQGGQLEKGSFQKHQCLSF